MRTNSLHQREFPQNCMIFAIIYQIVRIDNHLWKKKYGNDIPHFQWYRKIYLDQQFEKINLVFISLTTIIVRPTTCSWTWSRVVSTVVPREISSISTIISWKVSAITTIWRKKSTVVTRKIPTISPIRRIKATIDLTPSSELWVWNRFWNWKENGGHNENDDMVVHLESK